ncbi:hypothetical protein QFC21_006704 [Naganishia friedmannii]|uniref:Uncharacterized protein n=1 Tax=Naganishia friedmannii TaxID=89922 RepID=A0ACC2V0Q7_9TREE|nr:hypothetical protein QFC21_006704 [Naganishia friedmannii]
MPKSVPTGKAAKKAQTKRLPQELADLSAESDNEEHEYEIELDGDDDDDVDDSWSSSSSSPSSSSSAVEITPPPPPKKQQEVAKQDIPRISYKKVIIGSAAVEKVTGRKQPECLKSQKLSML